MAIRVKGTHTNLAIESVNPVDINRQAFAKLHIKDSKFYNWSIKVSFFRLVMSYVLAPFDYMMLLCGIQERFELSYWYMFPKFS